jgi:hypothetical protein
MSAGLCVNYKITVNARARTGVVSWQGMEMKLTAKINGEGVVEQFGGVWVDDVTSL